MWKETNQNLEVLADAVENKDKQVSELQKEIKRLKEELSSKDDVSSKHELISYGLVALLHVHTQIFQTKIQIFLYI